MVYDGATAFMKWLNENFVDGSEKVKIIVDEVPLIHF